MRNRIRHLIDTTPGGPLIAAMLLITLLVAAVGILGAGIVHDSGPLIIAGIFLGAVNVELAAAVLGDW